MYIYRNNNICRFYAQAHITCIMHTPTPALRTTIACAGAEKAKEEAEEVIISRETREFEFQAFHLMRMSRERYPITDTTRTETPAPAGILCRGVVFYENIECGLMHALYMCYCNAAER